MTAGIQPATDASGRTRAKKWWPLPDSRPITVQHGDAFVVAFPRDRPLLSYGIDFPHVSAALSCLMLVLR